MKKQRFCIKASPKCSEANVIEGKHFRITVLTEGLLRLEYSKSGRFVDQPTQIVWNRDFPALDFITLNQGEQLEIVTGRLHLTYNKKEFSPHGLCIRVTDGGTWYFGEEFESLGGTARTLDGVDGACPLEPGILSQNGFTVLDDSASLLLTEDGWAQPRKEPETDLYFFGYGTDYLAARKDFFHLCGKTPMLPRYALGNWWSRYYAYTEESYLKLMDRFREERIPFTVAVMDMGWHETDIDPKYGDGWTGYTWNRTLFPDPERFMKELHQRGMKITLNVHPADGIRAHEEMYPQMARAMGVDEKSELPVLFNIADHQFLENYFDVVHHPLEEMGVDFWWIDWQQGSRSALEGLDPLWMLNHYHFLDSQRNGKRPMTFSRYAGPGSHRYPVGFSGDSIVTWESLDFQPYFTSTASNIGFGWWSHDIGGHMHGYRDDELETRWVQYGVFSPIMRLHSTNNEFSGKEPWRFPEEARQAMDRFLRLRHKMLPYLYTMNYESWKEDQALIQPLYYRYVDRTEAYEYKNGYFFGSQLLVYPVTTPRLPGIHCSRTEAWLPEGIYTDLFTGMVYESRKGRKLCFYRKLSSIPVLASAGAILPMTEEIFGEEAVRNPGSLRIQIFPGGDNSFTLYEDDNETCGYLEGKCVKTLMCLSWTGEQTFVIGRAEGAVPLIPSRRDYCLEFRSVKDCGLQVLSEGETAVFQKDYDAEKQTLRIEIKGQPVDRELKVLFPDGLEIGDNRTEERIYELLDQAEISFDLKEQAMNMVRAEKSPLLLASGFHALSMEEGLYGALLEFLTAKEE